MTTIKLDKLKFNINLKLILIGMITLFVHSGVFYFMFDLTKSNYDKTIKEHLVQSVNIMSTGINIDKLEYLLNSKEEDGSPLYKETVALLKKLHSQKSGLKYVYTLHQKKDGIYFGLDTADYIDSNKDGVIDHSNLNSKYDEVPEIIKKAFETKSEAVSEKPYSDKWGTFLGSYYPLFNKKGELVSMLCVEIDYGVYQAHINQIKYGLFVIYIIGVFSILGILFLIKGFYNKSMIILEMKHKEDHLWTDVKMAEVGKMMASLNHEINNPLMIIKGFTQQIINQPNMLEDKKSKCLNKINNSVIRIQNIISFVKSLVKNTDDDIIVDVNINKKIQECLEFLSFKIRGTSIQILFDPSSDYHINCQEIGLQQLLINLIGNSVEELLDNPNGRIKIYIEKGVYYTDIIIQDNGHGIPPHLVSKINTGLTTTKKDGTGLGLLLCKKILANNNGELIYKRVHNETLFVCRFFNKENE